MFEGYWHNIDCIMSDPFMEGNSGKIQFSLLAKINKHKATSTQSLETAPVAQGLPHILESLV